MTYTGTLKEEIAKSALNELENRMLLLGYIYTNATLENDRLIIFLENKSVAEKLFKTLKFCYYIEPKITLRTQKKFKIRRVFIFEIDDQKGVLMSELDNITLECLEEKKSFIKGVFLASGSINDPKKSHYHLEMMFDEETKSKFVLKVLKSLNFNFKMIKREKKYMLYLKAAEEISDFIKMLGAINSLFYFEDIRIYRDHANMVNRLNNCEQANYEKSLAKSDEQLAMIKFLKENDYMSLLDEKTQEVAEYRTRYPDESFQSLANIISLETNKKVSKSYINHHFRKIDDIYTKIKNHSK